MQRLKYDPAIDGLRALAVGSVMLFHAYNRYFPGGWIGVDLFFVISGYLITRLIAHDLETTGGIDLRSFYLKRFLRLTPALFWMLIFVAIVAALDQKFVPAFEFISSATYTSDWFYAFWRRNPTILGHTWSLSIEEQFYLIWPAILLCVGVRRAPYILGALLLVVIAWRFDLIAHHARFYRVYYAFDTHADGLLIGCLLALVPSCGPAIGNAIEDFALALFLAFCVAVIAAGIAVAYKPLGFTAISALGCSLIVAAEQPGIFRSLMSLKPLVFVGRMSYGMYLWHWPLLKCVGKFYPSVPTFVVLAASFGMAVISFYVLESPWRRLKHKVGSTQRSPPKAALATEASAASDFP